MCQVSVRRTCWRRLTPCVLGVAAVKYLFPTQCLTKPSCLIDVLKTSSHTWRSVTGATEVRLIWSKLLMTICLWCTICLLSNYSIQPPFHTTLCNSPFQWHCQPFHMTHSNPPSNDTMSPFTYYISSTYDTVVAMSHDTISTFSHGIVWVLSYDTAPALLCHKPFSMKLCKTKS